MAYEGLLYQDLIRLLGLWRGDLLPAKPLRTAELYCPDAGPRKGPIRSFLARSRRGSR